MSALYDVAAGTSIGRAQGLASLFAVGGVAVYFQRVAVFYRQLGTSRARQAGGKSKKAREFERQSGMPPVADGQEDASSDGP